MNRNMSVSRFAADLIGPMARQSLSPHSSGTILASCSRAIYLRSAGGEVLWLAPGDVPMHRRGIRVPVGLPGPQPGSAYRVADGGLRLGGAASIELGRACVWEAERPTPACLASEAEVRSPQNCASGLLSRLPSPAGFGVFLPVLVEYSSGTPFPGRAPRRDPIIESAHPAICGIARACREQDLAALLRHAECLVGMGEGLTPSGDDYIGGVLFGLAMLQEAGARLAWHSPRGVASFLEVAATRTNLISAAFLADHAAGHASEVLQRFALAVLMSESPEIAHRAASDLIRLGHSTGWDLLTGAWTAMTLVPSGAQSARRQACAPALAAAN